MKVFIDGANGTVGMAIAEHLERLVENGTIDFFEGLPASAQKHRAQRAQAMSEADLVVLCVPDSEAPNAVQLVRESNPKARIIDASAAHRCQAGWTYGLPERYAREIATSQFIANPGCFATACVLLAYPLTLSGVLPVGESLAFHGMTGYSAAGKKGYERAQQGLYPIAAQFGAPHRHLPEIARHGQVVPTLFTTVGPWERGMMVQACLAAPLEVVRRAFSQVYEQPGQPRSVMIAEAKSIGHMVSPQACNGTTDALVVLGSQHPGTTQVAVVIDNLDRGAAGNVARCIELVREGMRA